MKPTFSSGTTHAECKCGWVMFRQKDDHQDPLFACIFCDTVVGSKSAIEIAVRGEGAYSATLNVVRDVDGVIVG